MSLQHQDRSPHGQFKQSTHRQRVVRFTPPAPPHVEFEWHGLKKAWHGFRNPPAGNPMFYGANQASRRAHYLQRDYSVDDVDYVSTFEGVGGCPQGSPGDVFWPDFSGTVSSESDPSSAAAAACAAANTLNWTTEVTGSSYYFDEYLAQPTDAPLDTSALDPGSFTGGIVKPATGISENADGTFYLPKFQPRQIDVFDNAPKSLFSGYNFFDDPLQATGLKAVYHSIINCRRTRFRNVDAEPATYFFAVAQWACSGATVTGPPVSPHIFGPVEIVASGTAATNVWIEINLPSDFADDWAFINSPGDGEDRLSVGKVIFCILNETPAHWSSRTGIALA